MLLSSRIIKALLAGVTRPAISTLTPAPPAMRSDPDRDWRRKNTHAHPLRDAMLVLAGATTQSLAGRVYRGKAGALFLFGAGEPHDSFYLPPSTRDCTFLAMYCFRDAIYCDAFHTRRGRARPLCRFIFTDTEIVNRLHATWDGGADGTLRRDVAVAQLRALFGLLSAAMAQRDIAGQLTQRYQGQKEPSRQAQAMLRVKDYIVRMSGRECRVEILARISGYSPSHLNRLFHRHYRLSVRDAIRQSRLLRFADLRQRHTPAKVMALELGFSSTAVFDHWKHRAG